MFDTHRNPVDASIVGRRIRSVIGAMFADSDEAFMQALRERTLTDCIALPYAKVERTGGEGIREGGAR